MSPEAAPTFLDPCSECVGVMQPSDEVFERLLEVTGAASLDDTASVNAAINIAYPGTGATPLMAAAGHGRLTEVSPDALGLGAGFTAAERANLEGQDYDEVRA